MKVAEYVDVMNSPASRVEQLMHEDGLNQQELAAKIGLHYSSISKYLSTEGELSPRFLKKLRDSLGWSQEWIATGMGSQRVTKAGHDESVNTQQVGRGNKSQFNYKSGVNQSNDEAEYLRTRIKDLEAQNELLREINELLKQKK